MVEITPTLLKKPLFRDPKKFFQETLKRYHGKDVRDIQGNTLAHLSILCGSYESLPELMHLLDVKNKEEITPRDLIQFLDIHVTPSIKPVKLQNLLYVYKTQEKVFSYLSQEEIQSHFHIEYLDRLVINERVDLLDIFKRCSKKLSDPLIKRKNQWIDSLYGNTFLSRKFPSTYIRWVDPLIGYGLFAGENISQYSLIGEYTGVVRRRKHKLDKYNNYIFGYVAADRSTPFVIDAQARGNHTRFVNHSDEPNLYSTWLIVKNVCHVILVTKQAIPKDTQLTYDYGPSYWKKRSDPLII